MVYLTQRTLHYIFPKKGTDTEEMTGEHMTDDREVRGAAPRGDGMMCADVV
jgi:hypothetical protein